MVKKSCSAGQTWDGLINNCIPIKTERVVKKPCSAGKRWDGLINNCISIKTERVVKKPCSAGQTWDRLINNCISIKTERVVNKPCSAGQTWDRLINNCIPSNIDTRPKPGRPTEPPVPVELNQVRVMAPSPQVDQVMMLGPALWIFVVLGTVGSIMALALWVIIYRRETRHSSTTEDADPGLQPLQKTEPHATIHSLTSERNGQTQMFQRAEEAQLSYPHLQLVDQTGKWEDGFIACRSPTKHAEKEGDGGLPACSIMRVHKIPLPATELGGTALVTTKTL